MSAEHLDRVCHVAPARELLRFDLGAERADIRGWPAFGSDARRVGAIDRLLVEQATKVVRYVSIAVAADAGDDAGTAPGGSVLVPIGIVRRHDSQRAVVLEGLSSQQVAAAPRLHARPVTRGDEDAALAALGLPTSRDVPEGALYDGPLFDESPLRRSGRDE